MSKKRKYVALDESIQESGCGIENYIELPLRYLNMRNGEEKFFKHEEKEVQLNAEETAFVLVDIWGFSRMSERIKASCGRRSFCERADKIVTEKIKPSLDAARKLELTIIYLPTEYVAIKYPQYRRLKRKLNIPAKLPTTGFWPPKEFVRKNRDEFEEGRYWKGFQKEDTKRRELTYISKIIKPQEDEYIVSNGDEMNEVLRKRKILNLIYVGFATNMCLIDKPGAMMEMRHKRGYRTILLRDCTTAVENHNTVNDLLMTKIWIEWIEMTTVGYTTSSEAFIKAINKYLSKNK